MVVASETVVGHVAPVWLGFKGGKGVATSAGALLGVWPVLTVAGLLGAVVWFAVVKLTGYVGLASVAAAVALAMGRPAAEIVAYAGVATGLALLVVWRHRSNLRNLRAGIEPRAAWTGRG
jgi:glycerol-3-phosphate acyltransferase PlsY